jgi:hypothetical protein
MSANTGFTIAESVIMRTTFTIQPTGLRSFVPMLSQTKFSAVRWGPTYEVPVSSPVLLDPAIVKVTRPSISSSFSAREKEKTNKKGRRRKGKVEIELV